MAEDSKDIEKLYEFGERLNESKDKGQNAKDYEGIIEVAKYSTKTKQLAAQLIPRFFKFFPDPVLSEKAVNTQIDLCEEDDLGVRVQAIRGLPLFCKDTAGQVSRIVDILVQLLTAEENVERDAVQKALLSLLRQDVKASLTALFRHINATEASADENIRERVLSFIRDKVFPISAELLKPQEQMERHITDLIKCSLGDVTGDEFKMFIEFLIRLRIFGDKAPPDRIQELIEIIEGQADIDSHFNVSDGDHIERLLSCLYMALPFFMRGASNSKFLNYLNKHILPVFDKLPEERKVDLLKELAEISPYATPQDSRQILPTVAQLLKRYVPKRKAAASGEEMNFTYAECLLYTFHHLASKAPNATNSLCGYAVMTGQPSDRLGEDFSENGKEFMERMASLEDMARTAIKKLTQGMAEHNRGMAAAAGDEPRRDAIRSERQKATAGLRTCNNLLAMTQPLHSKSPVFIGDRSVALSWKEAPRSPAPPAAKRPSPALNGRGGVAAFKKPRGGVAGLQSPLVNRAFEGLSSARGGWQRGGGRGARWTAGRTPWNRAGAGYRNL